MLSTPAPKASSPVRRASSADARFPGALSLAWVFRPVFGIVVPGTGHSARNNSLNFPLP